MEDTRPRRYLAAGLTFGILVALLIVPATRYIVRTQMAMVIPVRPPMALLHFVGSREADTTAVVDAIQTYASHHRDDYRVQLSSALEFQKNSVDKVAAMRRMSDRFPDNASLYANILRFETQGTVVGCRRDEEYLLSAEPQRKNPKLTHPTAEELSAFDREAAEGERLEPDNAYFPLMRSIGFFAGHRDSEAIDAIGRAAAMRRWDEHYEDELYGRWTVMEEALGEHGGIPRTAAAAALLFPQCAAMRSSARVAIGKAIEAELEGRTEAGLRIRKSVIRCGELMRAEGRTLITNLVGSSITILASTRPGGAPLLKDRPKLLVDLSGIPMNEKLAERKHREALFSEYRKYLLKVGHPEEAEFVSRVSGAGEKVRDNIPIPHPADWSISLLTLGTWWGAGIAMLTNALWMLALGACAFQISKSRRFDVGRPLSGRVRLSVGLSLSLCTILAGETAISGTNGAVMAIGAAILIGLVFAGSFAFKWPDVRRGLAIMAVTAIIFGAVIGLVLWQARSGSTIANAMFMLFSMSEGGNSDWMIVSRIVMTLSYLPVIPLIAVFVFSLVSLCFRVPAVTGVVRGFRGLGLPIACVLLIGYAVVVVGTARREANHNADMDRWVQGEGRYVFEIWGMSGRGGWSDRSGGVVE